MTAQQLISLERNRSRVGQECDVLVENVRTDGTGTGRSAAEAPEGDGVILIDGVDENDIGNFIRVRITEARTYDLLGVKL
jgi:ribosomal protein S12 methylthiotransferase